MEEVRPPMEFKTERLIDPPRRGRPRKNNTRSSNENELADSLLQLDLEDVLRQSRIEYDKKQIEEEQRRQETFAKFENIRFQMKRIGRLDKEIQGLYLVIHEYS